MEEEHLQPVDRFVDQLQETCENTPCNPWLLCLNTLFCWMAWVTVKITEWVLMVLIRWVLRPICVVLMLAIGLLALLIGNTEILIQAVRDLIEFVLDTIYFVVGFVIGYVLTAIDVVLTFVGWQDPKRKLTKEEVAMLRPIFGDSLFYGLIRIGEGPNQGVMSPGLAPGSATTIGYNIYMRVSGTVSPDFFKSVLVHECVHVWQFQFGGTYYIGQSAINQALSWFGAPDPYAWWLQVTSDVNSWYYLAPEAQAELIQNVFDDGIFVYDDGRLDDDSPGAFFSGQSGGRNQYADSRVSITADELTAIANAGWTFLKTG